MQLAKDFSEITKNLIESLIVEGISLNWIHKNRCKENIKNYTNIFALWKCFGNDKNKLLYIKYINDHIIQSNNGLITPNMKTVYKIGIVT